MSPSLIGIATIDIVFFTLLVLTAIAIIRQRNLFAVAMLSGVFSLLSAGLFVTLDAMDVAFTEAAVGAGISTVLMLGTLALTTKEEKPPKRSRFLPFLVCIVAIRRRRQSGSGPCCARIYRAHAHRHWHPQHRRCGARELSRFRYAGRSRRRIRRPCRRIASPRHDRPPRG